MSLNAPSITDDWVCRPVMERSIPFGMMHLQWESSAMIEIMPVFPAKYIIHLSEIRL